MKKIVNITLTAVAAAFGLLTVVGLVRKPGSVYKDQPGEQNPFEGHRVRFVVDESEPPNADGVRGHLEKISDKHNAVRTAGFYEKVVKRGFDIILSFAGLVLLSPVFLVISCLIYLDDPGPVLFTQKRVGRDKQYFRLHKFRSMKMSTPHDVPTHQLENPDAYITEVGKILRRSSLDELPQIWDIWLGNMSVIGPRPALWNQDLLTALRDHGNTSAYDYENAENSVKAGDVDANSATPGLTGLAQIKGRDELELEDKARLDRKYVEKISFLMDVRCFLGTIASVLKHDGVVEGGTGRLQK